MLSSMDDNLLDRFLIYKAVLRNPKIISSLFSYSSLIFHQIRRGYPGDDILRIIRSFVLVLGSDFEIVDFDFGRFYKDYPDIYIFVRTCVYREDWCEYFTKMFQLIVDCSINQEVIND